MVILNAQEYTNTRGSLAQEYSKKAEKGNAEQFLYLYCTEIYVNVILQIARFLSERIA